MKEESKFMQGKRVRHANAVSSHVTPSNFPSSNTDLDKLNGNDLKGMRHQVEQGIGNGVVADADVKEYFRFLDKIDGAIEKRNRRELICKGARQVRRPSIRSDSVTTPATYRNGFQFRKQSTRPAWDTSRTAQRLKSLQKVRRQTQWRAASHCLHSFWSSVLSTALTQAAQTLPRQLQASALFQLSCSQHCTTNPLQRN